MNTGGGEGVPGYDALLTGGETYVEWGTGEKEYYDLGTDPRQLDNSYPSLPESDRAELSRRLDALKACSGDACRAAEGPGSP